MSRLAIDVGCGAKKRAGHVGLDLVAAPGVDHVLDFTKERFPFEDASVDAIYTSHCLEHIADPMPVLREMTRVAKDGAEIQIWVPHSTNSDAFLLDHVSFWNERIFRHMGEWFPDVWRERLGARWIVHEIVHVVPGEIVTEMRKNLVDLTFAINHLHDVVLEIGARITVDKATPQRPHVTPARLYATDREIQRHPLQAEPTSVMKRIAQKLTA